MSECFKDKDVFCVCEECWKKHAEVTISNKKKWRRETWVPNNLYYTQKDVKGPVKGRESFKKEVRPWEPFKRIPIWTGPS